MTEVRLSPAELYIATIVGARRNLESIYKGRKPRFAERSAGELYGTHVLGAQAECVVAKYLNVYWPMTINHFECGDIMNMEIRFSNLRTLKVRERDKGPVILVSGGPSVFDIKGWLDAAEARSMVEPKCPRRDGPPAYFVPEAKLRSIDELPGNR